jgi:hypothetical protein
MARRVDAQLFATLEPRTPPVATGAFSPRRLLRLLRERWRGAAVGLSMRPFKSAFGLISATACLALYVSACASLPDDDGLGGLDEDTIATGEQPLATLSCKCGGDVTAQVERATAQLVSDFSALSTDDQWKVCEGIYASMSHAALASWDIRAFYRTECTHATTEGSCGTADCIGSVTVAGGCYGAMHVNYILWGAGNRMCNGAFPLDPRFSRAGMHAAVAGYRCKKHGCQGVGDRQAWSDVGWKVAGGAELVPPRSNALFGGREKIPSGGTCGAALVSNADLAWHFGGPEKAIGRPGSEGTTHNGGCIALKETGSRNNDRP